MIYGFQKSALLVPGQNCDDVLETDIYHHPTIKKARQTSDMLEMVSHVCSPGVIAVDLLCASLLSTSQDPKVETPHPQPVKTWILGK